MIVQKTDLHLSFEKHLKMNSLYGLKEIAHDNFIEVHKGHFLKCNLANP